MSEFRGKISTPMRAHFQSPKRASIRGHIFWMTRIRDVRQLHGCVVTLHVRDNLIIMTADKFCDWVNTELLPNATIPPGCPHQIKNRTATKWLHDLGFRPQSHKKAFILTDMSAVMWLNIAPCTCGIESFRKNSLTTSLLS